MHATLQPLDADLARRTDAMLARVAALDPAQRSFRPEPAAWSALQVVDHLARTEGAVAEALAAGLPAGRRRRRLRDLVAFPLVLLVLRTRMRVKAPLRRVVPEGERPLAELEADWRAARDEVRARLAALPAAELGRAVVAHPIGGPATPAKLLAFLDAHVRHHEFQLDRLAAHPRFPGGGRPT